MLLSFNWLKDYVAHTLPPAVLAEKLTMLGMEVTACTTVNAPIPGLVIGEVMTREKHPNADKLWLTTIRFQQEAVLKTVPVICGAPNIAAGQKIAYATVGTRLPNGMTIKKVTIRGVVSEGMVCSLAELGKEDVSETIWVLPPQATLTEAIATYMGQADVIFNIDLTSNRNDALSVIGMAREVAIAVRMAKVEQQQALNGHASISSFPLLQPKSTALRKTSSPQVDKQVTVHVHAKAAALRYTALALSGVKIGPSPRWICDRLTTHGLRPINNIVDVTNLIMLEYGQPLHAFDRKKLAGATLVVRYAQAGEKLITLDGREVSLVENDLVIADEEKPVGLAGIMGGRESGISEQTTEIVLEAACFDPATIKAMSTRLAMPTEAAKRFIQGAVDMTLTAEANVRAAELIEELGGRSGVTVVTAALVDVKEAVPARKPLSLTRARIKRDLKLALSLDDLKSLLEQLGCTVKVTTPSSSTAQHSAATSEDRGELQVLPPFFRKDLNYTWDLVEEVARCYGYDRLPVTLPHIYHNDKSLKSTLYEQAHALACTLGYQEIISYPFIAESYFLASGEEPKACIQPSNPILQKASVLRTSMVAGALKAVKTNLEQRSALAGRYFELGHVFALPQLTEALTQQAPSSAAASPAQPPPAQRELTPIFHKAERRVLGLLLFTPFTDRHWCGAAEDVDFYTLSGDMEQWLAQMLPGLAIKKIAARQARPIAFLSPSESAYFQYKKQTVGYLGHVSTPLIKAFALPSTARFYYGEFDLDVIETLQKRYIQTKHYQTTSPYPYLTRDVALVVREEVELGSFLADFKKAHHCVEKVALLELYRGKELLALKDSKTLAPSYDAAMALKSFVFRLYLRSGQKTLLNPEADRIVKHIIAKLAKKHSFILR